jgi:hypothetical protein
MRIFLILLLFSFISCNKKESQTDTSVIQTPEPTAFSGIKTITYNNVSVDAIIDKPALADVDVLILYHGTVMYDDKILEAAQQTMDAFKDILNRKDMMIVSVAYPEENLLMGDNIMHSEAALLWVKNKASEEMNVNIKKIFLAGHSQGGYIVTRLNTMHATNGVIANAPGPLNLVYRCQLEENGQIPSGITCTLLQNTYGTTSLNPDAYWQRSLLNFTEGFKSPILFVQGMDDSPIQMYSWPIFKQEVENCATCQSVETLEIPGFGHGSLFGSEVAINAFNQFIEKN